MILLHKSFIIPYELKKKTSRYSILCDVKVIAFQKDLIDSHNFFYKFLLQMVKFHVNTAMILEDDIRFGKTFVKT